MLILPTRLVAAKRYKGPEPSRLESSDPIREAGVTSTGVLPDIVRAIVPVPPVIVMVAPSEVLRNAQQCKEKAAPRGGNPKKRGHYRI